MIRKRSVKDLLTSKERIRFLTERVARGESSPETFKKALKELSNQGLLKPSDVRYFENMSSKSIEDSIQEIHSLIDQQNLGEHLFKLR